MDLSKASTQTAEAVSQLWTAYHTKVDKLSAVIPIQTYERMVENARHYPQFVVPLERGDDAKEMHFLVRYSLLPCSLPHLGLTKGNERQQWTLLPPSAAGAPPDAVTPSTLLFTPLAQYQLHQTYAQPFLVLTHYTDLARSHGIVLMRGEVTPEVSLGQQQAQMLAVKASLFYNCCEGESKQGLLKDFHERPREFKVERLLEEATL
jgi:ATP synthase F1 complex assembly factor 1